MNCLECQVVTMNCFYFYKLAKWNVFVYCIAYIVQFSGFCCVLLRGTQHALQGYMDCGHFY